MGWIPRFDPRRQKWWRFLLPLYVQSGSGAYSAFCKMSIRAFPEVKLAHFSCRLSRSVMGIILSLPWQLLLTINEGIISELISQPILKFCWKLFLVRMLYNIMELFTTKSWNQAPISSEIAGTQQQLVTPHRLLIWDGVELSSRACHSRSA